ncbi:2OG-Fe(II) oxygenase [Leptolyngbya sp. AN03gr2]|uniref:2OG-Fe(II) oxygenase n=1 Tax=Leptolyngbya sp. AN03gr2 TaxID=3423364 RepID=UPI003D319623
MYVRLYSFLSLSERHELLQQTETLQGSFVSSITSTGAEDYRRSTVLYDTAAWRVLMEQKIRPLLFFIFDSLGLPSFEPEEFELQLTSHSEGGFYLWHTDNGTDNVKRRRLTFVYYFWNEPKSFAGGNLEIQTETGVEKIEPINNSIVFFDSGLLHQVTLVQATTERQSHLRMTLNGWLRD